MLRCSAHTPIRRLVLWLTLIVSAAASACAIVGCGRQSAEATVTRRDITAYVPLEGKVVVPASAKADVYSPYTVPVDQVYVTVGQQVRRGEALILFHSPRNQVYYQQARATLVRAEKSLAQARARFAQDVKVAQKRLAASRSAERKARQAAAAPAAPSAPGAGPSSADQRPSTTVTPDVGAAAQVRQADEQALVDARARMNEGLVPYQQALASAQEQFAAAQAGSKAAQVKSPIGGTVLAVNASVGKTPDPESKTPLVTIVDLEALNVAAGVPEDELRLLRPKNKAVVTIREVPNVEFPGSVDEVYSEKAGFLQGQRYVALVSFTNIDGRAKPDMEATARIQTGRARDVLAVPANAITTVDSHQHAVKVRVGKGWHRRLIETGLSDGKYTEVKSGLQEGDIVQTNP